MTALFDWLRYLLTSIKRQSVEIKLTPLLTTLLSLMTQQYVYKAKWQKVGDTSQVAGLSGPHYENLVDLSKQLSVKMLPLVFGNFGGLCAPYIYQTTESLIQYSRNNSMTKCDMSAFFGIIEVVGTLAATMGMSGVTKIMQPVAF